MLITICACNNNLTTIGQDMIDNGSVIELKKYSIDKISTIKQDSFPTSTGSSVSALSEIFMGQLNDEQYSGKTVVIPTFQICPSTYPNISNYATLDSVTFNIGYSGHIWGDTANISVQSLKLCQLKELPTLDEEKDHKICYNNHAIPEISRELATLNFIPRTGNLTDLYFKLDNDGFGKELFEKLMYADDDILAHLPWDFINYFKGLCILPGENNNFIMGINTGSSETYMKFYYRVNETQYTFTLPITQKEYQYYNIQNTPLESLSSLKRQTDEVSFYDNNEIAIAQGMSGYIIKIILPHPETYQKYKTIVKAELELKPRIYYDDKIGYPSSLIAYRSDNENQIKGYLYNSTSSQVVGYLNYNQFDISASTYTFDLTEYYQNLSNLAPSQDGDDIEVLLSVPSMNSSYDRVVVDRIPTLKIYYAYYNK